MTEQPLGAEAQSQSSQEVVSSESPTSPLPGRESRFAGLFRLRPLNRIAMRFLLWAFGLALLPIGILVWVSLNQAEDAIHDEAMRKLMLVANDRHNRVEEHLRQIRGAVQSEGLEPFVARLISSGGLDPGVTVDVVKAQLGEALRSFAGSDVEVLVADMNGRVVASTDPAHVGSDCSGEDYFLQGRKSAFLSSVFFDTVTQQMTWVASAPIVNEADRSLRGVLMSYLDPGHLGDVLETRDVAPGANKGKDEADFKGRTYMVDWAGHFLTPSPFVTDSLRDFALDTKPLRYLHDNRIGMSGDYTDSRGIRVIGATEFIPEMKWMVVVEADYSEAMARYARFRSAIIVLALVVFGLTLVLALRLGATIARPLRDLVRAEERLARGDELSALVPDEKTSSGEIGDLIRQRNVVIQRVLSAEKRHRDLVDEIDGIAWEAEVGTWRFTFVNRRAEQILGYPPEQWLSEPGFWVRHLHPLDRSRTVQAYLEASITGKDLRLEYRMIASDGHPVWLRDQAHLVTGSFMSDGRPVRQLRGLMIDITAAKQAQDLLQESERRARTIIDMSHNAMIGIDSKGEVSVFNRAAEQMFQITAREIIGQSTVRLVPEKYRERHVKAIAHYLETGRSAGVIGQPREMQGLRNDGSIFPMEISLTPTKDKSIRVIAIIQDITARKRADEELRQRYRQLDGIHDLTSALMHAESIDEIYAQAMACTKISLGAERASILLSDPGGPMRFRAWDGLSEPYRCAMEGRMPWREDDHNPRPLLVSDTSKLVQIGPTQPTILGRKELEEIEPIIVNEGIGAMMVVPLVFQGRLLGRLMAYFNAPREFAETEVHLGQTIAAHVAFAIGRQRANDVLKAVVEGASPSTGDEFFRILVRHLAGVLHVRWAFVGESITGGVDKIRTLAMWAGNSFAENIEYDLSGTPCEGVMGRNMCCHPKGVAPMFPQDPLLAEMGVESYLGVRLSDSNGSSLGILVVMHDAPLVEPTEAETILMVFAARASVELERLQAEKRRRGEQQWYTDMAEQIGEAFVICHVDTGRVVGASRALHSLLGYALEEMRQATIHNLLASDRASAERYLRSHAADRRHTIAPMRFRTKSGTVFEAEASTSPFVSGGEEYLFVVIRGADQLKQGSPWKAGAEQAFERA